MTYRLSIYDVITGQINPVLVTERLIEAPNWHPDGYLLVNGEGLLFRVNLDNPDLEHIRIEGLEHLNNDHGITPDGTTLIVSNSPEPFSSVIYSVAVQGGVPKKITPQSPSWWHGISPDGNTIAYTANRSGVFAIYTCPFVGGKEQKLTERFDHTDGPDYSPDGEWIWFNGAREGSMNLWRMRHDGSDLERMTDDCSDDWFPHPSPDGKHVLYLAYEAGTEGHPRNKDVELRLLSLSEGKTRTLLPLFGGQGTINVPCWNPSGTGFAFVDVLKDDGGS
jgi:Tol biopolymer transport system component